MKINLYDVAVLTLLIVCCRGEDEYEECEFEDCTSDEISKKIQNLQQEGGEYLQKVMSKYVSFASNFSFRWWSWLFEIEVQTEEKLINGFQNNCKKTESKTKWRKFQILRVFCTPTESRKANTREFTTVAWLRFTTSRLRLQIRLSKSKYPKKFLQLKWAKKSFWLYTKRLSQRQPNCNSQIT